MAATGEATSGDRIAALPDDHLQHSANVFHLQAPRFANADDPQSYRGLSV
jgi:hypothetical protein